MRFSLLITVLLFSSQAIYAQKRAVIRYEVKAVKQDTSVDAIMSEALLKKSEFTFMYKRKRRARVDLKAGSFFQFVTIFDHKKGKFLRLVDDQKNKIGKFGDIYVIPDSAYYVKSIYNLEADTMTILGYKCKKATTESKYGKLVCWYTEEIPHNFKQIDFLNIDVPGMPLYFESNSGKVNMTFRAVKIDKLKRKDRKQLKLKLPEGYTMGTSVKAK